MQFKRGTALPGLDISVIGFGTWSLGAGSGWNGSSDARSIATVHQTLDCGINVVDTAPVHGLGESEGVPGAVLRGRRHEIILASKRGLVWDEARTVRNDLSRDAIIGDVDRALAWLGTDRLDLLQLHWPDPGTALEDTAEGLRAVLDSGKVGAIGVTDVSLADTRRLAKMAPLASFQGLYNLLERNPDSYHGIPLDDRSEAEILPCCQAEGLAFLPYSPLFQGLLTDNFSEIATFDETDVRAANPKLRGADLAKYLEICGELKAIADAAGHGLTHLAIAWLCENGAVTSVLCGAQHPDQIAQNAAAAEVSLGAEMRARIASLLERHGL